MTRITKNDMARVIVQALYNLPELPASDHKKVLRMAARSRKAVEWEYKTAHKILTDKVVSQ